MLPQVLLHNPLELDMLSPELRTEIEAGLSRGVDKIACIVTLTFSARSATGKEREAIVVVRLGNDMGQA